MLGRRWALVVAALLVGSCSNATSKDGDGSDDETNQQTNAETNQATNGEANQVTNGQTSGGGRYLLDDLDEPCDDDPELTGRALLADLADRYESVLEYTSTEGEVTGLRLEIEYDGGDITCVPGSSPPPGSRAPEVPPKIELEVSARFETDDQQFQEEVPSMVTSGSLTGGGSWDGSRRHDELAGSFEPQLLDEFGPQVRVSWRATLTGSSSNGSISLVESNQTKPVAHWPAAE